jgi:uncharacterized protein YciI
MRTLVTRLGLVVFCGSLAAALTAAEGTQPPFGMTTYTLGLLVKGPKWTAEETPALQKLQEAHLAHIGEMARSGALLAAGPLTDNGTIRGILIFKVPLEEARALAEQDPAVKAGRLTVELHPWMTAKGALNEPPASTAGAKKEER